MFIEEFLWLPNIVDKLISKYYVTPEEVEDVFSIVRVFAFTKRDMCKVRICTRRLGKLTEEGI